RGGGGLVVGPAEGEPPRRNAPTAANRLDGVGGRPAALLQPVQRERTMTCRYDIRKLFDLEIFRLLLDLHGASQRKEGCPKRDRTLGRGFEKKKRSRNVGAETVAQSASTPVVSLDLISGKSRRPPFFGHCNIPKLECKTFVFTGNFFSRPANRHARQDRSTRPGFTLLPEAF